MLLPYQTVNWSEDHRPDMAVTQPDAAIVHLLELSKSSEVLCRTCKSPLAWVMVGGCFSFADCRRCGTPYTPPETTLYYRRRTRSRS